MHGLPVSNEVPVTHLKRVTRDADDPLDVVEPRIDRIGEDNHIPAPRRMEGGQLASASGDAGPVDELVDEEKVTLEQGVLHAAARDLERLHPKGAETTKSASETTIDVRPMHEERNLASGASAVREVKGVAPVCVRKYPSLSIPV